MKRTKSEARTEAANLILKRGPELFGQERPLDELMRGTGRSTAGMLEAIAYAIRHPNLPVPLIDHSGNDRSTALLLRPLQGIVKTLGLNIEVRFKPGVIYLTSLIDQIDSSVRA